MQWFQWKCYQQPRYILEICGRHCQLLQWLGATFCLPHCEELSNVLHHFKCPATHLATKTKGLFDVILIYTKFSRDADFAPVGFPSGLVVKNLPAMQQLQETWVQSLGCEDPLEKGKATHSSITLPWRIPWTEEPGRLQCTELQSVRHDWSEWACTDIVWFRTSP